VGGLRHSWATERQVAAALYAGDRFAARDDFSAAMGEYDAAAALDPDNAAVQRRILDLGARRLSYAAFVDGPGHDAALDLSIPTTTCCGTSRPTRSTATSRSSTASSGCTRRWRTTRTC
jgi:hypothetical protein